MLLRSATPSCCCSTAPSARPRQVQQCSAAPLAVAGSRQNWRVRRCMARSATALAPTVVAPTTSTAGPPWDGGQATILGELSAEQHAAVNAPEQHVRVIAGPGSGKTTFIVGGITRCLQEGALPESVVAVSFTRKAAEEMKDRLGKENLTVKIFHALCWDLLRKKKWMFDLKEWELLDPRAVEDVQASIMRGVLKNMSGAQKDLLKSECILNVKGGKEDDTAEEVEAHKRKMAKEMAALISRMKNFSPSVAKCSSFWARRESGHQVVQQLLDAGKLKYIFKDITQLQTEPDALDLVAEVYDKYHSQLGKKLDFDDQLHFGLALVRDVPQVKAALHKRWRYIFVDEAQDINPCQWEFITEIVGPSSRLFMVGDPDQAIYGFRGADNSLFRDRFTEVYPNSGEYTLSDNYRCGQKICDVADDVRSHERGDVPMTPMNSQHDKPGEPVFLSVESQAQEQRVIIQQLREWYQGGSLEGCSWGDMMIVCRTNQPLATMYRALLAAGIPADLQTGSFWESAEVKTALALLRAVACPDLAGEGLEQRVVLAYGDVKVPLTAGLGDKPLEQIRVAIYKDSCISPAPLTLGACLLNGCGMGSMGRQQAADVVQRWHQALALAGGTDDEDAPWDPSRLDALQGLAPGYQPLPQLSQLLGSLGSQQQTGMDRMRGLVQLGTAYATLGEPVEEVLKLLLWESGITPRLQEAYEAAAAVDDKEKSDALHNRIENLKLLVQLAAREAAAAAAAPQDPSSSDSEWDMDGIHTGEAAVNLTEAGRLLQPTQPLLQFLNWCAFEGHDSIEDPSGKVILTSIHKAKGREAKCGVVIGLHEGCLPSFGANSSDDLEQERNMAYVALTRFRDAVLGVYKAFGPKNRWTGQRKEQYPCRFVPKHYWQSASSD